MAKRIYSIVPPDTDAAQLTRIEDAAAQASGCEHLLIETDAASFSVEAERAIADPKLLGIAFFGAYRGPGLAYCSEAERSAQGTGSASVVFRDSDGRLRAANTDVDAFAELIRGQGMKRVRTALVLGLGDAAKAALAGLRELDCARYMLGFRSQRRIIEVCSLYPDLRRQFNFFPMDEMQHFLGWAEEQQIFSRNNSVPPPGDDLAPDDADDDIKRWDLLVDATPVAANGNGDETPMIVSENFLRCFNRVLDMSRGENGRTGLMQLAHDAGVPAMGGQDFEEQRWKSLGAFWKNAAKGRFPEVKDSRSGGSGSRSKTSSRGRGRSRMSVKRKPRKG